MPHSTAALAAPKSHHADRNIQLPVRGRVRSQVIRPTCSPARNRQHLGSNDLCRRSRDVERRPSALSHRPGLGKRRRSEHSTDNQSRAGSRGRYPAAKRPCKRQLPWPKHELCDECSKICWDGIERIATEKLRFTWKGRPIADVGRRYRNPPTNNCTLCRQLYAPWIEKYLENSRWIERKFIPDKGDRIHVYPNLQYVPHITNHQPGRNLLRAEDAPYHIAVVPIAPKWKAGVLEHLATRGMVVVLPDGRTESRVLQPQQLPRRFDPEPVRSWLETCSKGHRSRCNPRIPEVKGMRVIDCESENLAIRNHQPGYKYVALSYVWGAPPVNGSTGPPNTGASASTRPPRDPNVERTLRLPRDVPLTIRDAITVTKSLGYRYLWVDKYCIDQHNPKEQQEQFSRMGDIYAGSQIAIFALGDDSEAGLPGVSTTPRLVQEECRSGRYRFISTMPDPHEFIKYSQWSNRAWTLQEGLFSTRRLFFTNHQVYFECNAMNTTECLKSDLGVLHTNNRQRLRAYHRAGQFICGNSSSYSHLDVRRNQANHRKVDILRRCQHQITQYTKRELTNKDDILHAFAAIARFYAKTSAMIASLSGLPVPFPIANLPGAENRKQEGLDHLTYALSWSHEINNFDTAFPRRFFVAQKNKKQQDPWRPHHNPKPQRRHGFPSWSWAGWFGAVKASREHLPYMWTSLLDSVKIGFPDGTVKPFEYILGFERYKAYFIRELLTADTLFFDAHVLDARQVVQRLVTTAGRSNSRSMPVGESFSSVGSAFDDEDDPGDSSQDSSRDSATTIGDIEVRLSTGPASLKEFRYQMLLSARQQERGEGTAPYYQCIILGTHGEPRKDVYRAIKAQDKKRRNARKRRIELFEPSDPEDIVCLVVRTDPVNGVSHRRGLMKVRYYTGKGGLEALWGWDVGEKRSFILK
ncbi:HET domain containing protein [Rhypophila sp. PSN 637]